ncbi:replication initiator protein A [Rhizobium lentis]|uniref:replication initiator protein A n=2 Tax=Rhizobium/Agrobacterium group TaxID=227290 RepID=UPI0011074EC1|nr:MULTISPECIES: replication initiator protein A [Rhizobium]MBX4964124.1 replication initiator protein A [Rhizobium binae]MBX5002360.1 replication initiator protein A [Rhizobium lentis]MBX5020811.1 replication initiator protein A [Rhizobium lentis]MBX5087356.1 replication initiator protein A [Rhizobium lentis]MBX5100092.1 replication initiator protein A [Rhizobium lentis]
MASKKLNLRSRKAFAELSLHDKNAYLQEVAGLIMAVRGEDPPELDKDALARLRRYYSRRSMADLRLNEMGGPLRRAFESLADGIRSDEVLTLLKHELPAARRSAAFSRPAPIGDAQRMFFVPSVHDVPLKDDFNLMDIAPFALSKSGGAGVIRYELKDSIITVEGGAEVGLATAYDYDIVINMTSHLAEATRRFRIDEAKGLKPSIPPQVYRPAAAEILKFCRRELGGKQYEDLERALARLQATNIRITNLKGDRRGWYRRSTESFPLIGRYKVVSRTNRDRIDQVEIDIPGWVYEGVVRPDGKPTILTLNPDYFLLSRPITRFIYRLARRAAGDTTAFYSLKELHKRSGAKAPMRKFRQTIEEIVETAKTTPLPDYDLNLEDRGHDQILHMRKRNKSLPAEKDLAAIA